MKLSDKILEWLYDYIFIIFIILIFIILLTPQIIIFLLGGY